MPLVEDTDAELVARFKAGDPRSFDVIYLKWRSRIFNFLVRLVGNSSVAEDMLQETFLRLIAHRARLRDDTDMGAWLFTVARHLAVSYGRWRQFTNAALGVLRSTPEVARRDAPFDNAAANESMIALERALAALPPLYREVLLLVAVEGMSPSQAAAVIAVRPETLRKRLSRAREMLSDLLSKATPGPVLLVRQVEKQ